MTSLILENADLNRLFPKCRPRGGHPPDSGAGTHHLSAGHHQQHQPHDCRIINKKPDRANTSSSLSSASSTSVVTSTTGFPSSDMIDLERDNTDRQVIVIRFGGNGNEMCEELGEIVNNRPKQK